jgi:PilZ domain-containing protein
VCDQAAYHPGCLSDAKSPLIERRTAQRFQVDWKVRVECQVGHEIRSVEKGVLHNIGSSGALLSLTSALPTGTQIEIYVTLPLHGNKWMKYPASVVRIDIGKAAVATAVKFDSTRPLFGEPAVL